jgi:hypothetical protein
MILGTRLVRTPHNRCCFRIMVAQAYYEVNRLYRKLNNLIINQIRFAKMKRIFGKTIENLLGRHLYQTYETAS